MHIWLNNELDTLEEYFGRVARENPKRISIHYNDFKWYQRGKEERKLKIKVEQDNVDDVTLYRYITISQMWKIISSNKIDLLNPSLWKDPLESPFFNAKVWQEDRYVDTPFKNRFFAQCFTINDTSESMWKTYGFGEKLVRLKIKVGALRRLIENNSDSFDSNSFYLGRMVYLNFEDMKDLFMNGYRFEKTINLVNVHDQVKTLLVKRYAYTFEKEIRLIFDGHSKFTQRKAIPKVISLDIPNLQDLISEILLDPELSDHEISFYKDAWNFIPRNRIIKCNLYSKNDYQLKLGRD
ncbi:MAG: hypothetical protein KA734_01055 [Fluviicola sp.]|nr:hypothetical protein [Fluviicola sp.]MBP6074250.1 hypothetical protein [Flavobacterium sp.]